MGDNRRVKIKQPAIRPAVLLVCALASSSVTLALSGCQLFNEQLTAAPHMPYPEDIKQGEVFDVQVFRDVTLLRFTNTTTRDFGPSVIWINKRYSLAIPGFASGETVELELGNFVDEFGDVYRAGGFFAQRTPAPVVLVQIETVEDDEPILHGFVVVENKYN